MNENKQESNHAKSIRDIEISNRRREFENRISENKSGYSGVSYRKKNKKKWPKVLIILISLLFILTGVGFVFHKATIEVVPKKENLIFSNDIYTAVVSDEKLNQKEGKNIIKEKGKISEGEIRIFNNTLKTQKLRKETRFETEDNLIYKIYSSASIPSKKSVVVKAFSFGGGEEYLKKKGEKLTIPGFREAKMDNEFKNIVGEIESSFILTEKDFEKPAEEKIEEEKKESKVVAESMGNVKYNILEVKSELSEEVESIGVEETKKKSRGNIKIFNNTSKTQKLRKETRFRNNGMIFKTYKSVTIPAKSTAVAEAFSDLPGSQFNIEKGTKFDIPGFEEAGMDNEFKNIYGVAETDFTGGIEGKILVPNKDKLEKAKKSLKEKIIVDLKLEILKNDIRDKYIILDKDNPFIVYNYKTSFEDDKIILKLIASAKVPIIAKSDFIKMIFLSNEIKEYQIDDLAIDDFSQIKFKILNRDDFSIDSGDNFLFSVNGDVEVYWILDQDDFVESVRGKDLDEINNLLKKSFLNFEFNFKTSPFWRSSVPTEKKDIEIIIKK